MVPCLKKGIVILFIISHLYLQVILKCFALLLSIGGVSEAFVGCPQLNDRCT